MLALPLTPFNVKVKMDELNDNLLMTDYSITFEQPERFNQYAPKLRESFLWFTAAVRNFFETRDLIPNDQDRYLIYENLFQRQSLIDISEYVHYVNRCEACLKEEKSLLDAEAPHNPTAHIHEEFKAIFHRHQSTDLQNEDITQIQLYQRYLDTAARPVYETAPFSLTIDESIKLYQDLYRIYGLI
nr:MAG TPA: hypothetical protein [Caudoviricetes sp.]